jgi:hypothetical protein
MYRITLIHPSSIHQVFIDDRFIWRPVNIRISLNSRLRVPRDAHKGFKCYTLLPAGLLGGRSILLEAKYLDYHVKKEESAVRVLQWNSPQHNDEAGQWP